MKSINTLLLAAFLSLNCWTGKTQGDVVISNFSMSPNSIQFDISGTFPLPLPPNARNQIFFVNPNVAANPGFALGTFLFSNSFSFSGTQPLTSLGIGTGNASAGDYFLVEFQSNFGAGETISGTLSATWGFTAFDPSQVTTLNVFWGADTSLPLDPTNQPSSVTGGTLLNTLAVPEPSNLLLLAAAGLTILVRRKRQSCRVRRK